MANEADDAATHDEGLASFFRDPEVDVTLAIAKLDVGETMPFFGKGQKILGKESYLLDVHGEFAGTRAEQVAADADVIAEVEQSVEIKPLVTDCVFFYVDLESLACLLEVSESGFAHETDRHDAASNAHVHARLLQLFRGFSGVLGEDLRNAVSEVVFARVGFLSERFNLFDLVAAKVVNLVVECQGVLNNCALAAASSRVKWETEIINGAVGAADQIAASGARWLNLFSRLKPCPFSGTINGSIVSKQQDLYRVRGGPCRRTTYLSLSSSE